MEGHHRAAVVLVGLLLLGDHHYEMEGLDPALLGVAWALLTALRVGLLLLLDDEHLLLSGLELEKVLMGDLTALSWDGCVDEFGDILETEDHLAAHWTLAWVGVVPELELDFGGGRLENALHVEVLFVVELESLGHCADVWTG